MISLGRIDPIPFLSFDQLPEFVRVRVDDGWEFGYCRKHALLMLDVQSPASSSPHARITVGKAIEEGASTRFALSELNHHSHRVVKVWQPKENFCRICQVHVLIGSLVPPDPNWMPLCGCICR